MADSFAQFAYLLRAYIAPAVIDLQFKDDDPAWNLMGTFAPDVIGGKRAYDVTAADFPPGYEARYEVKVQSAGRVAGGSFAGNTLQMLGKDSHLPSGQAIDALYLDPTKTPLAGYIEVRTILKRIIGSVTVNYQQHVADMASKPVDEVAGGAIMDGTRRFRGYLINALHGNGYGTLAQVNNAAGYTVPETAGGIEVSIDAGTYGRFMKGDIIVAGTNADPRVQIAGAVNGYMRVVNMDATDRTIHLQSEPGEGNISLVDNCHLMLADSYDFSATTARAGSLVPEGFESLLLNTGRFPGSSATAGLYDPTSATPGLDVEHHSELRSFVVDTESAMEEPTMDAITLQLDKILDSGHDVPTALIAERSLWTYHNQLERESHSVVQVPMGQMFTAAGGTAGPVLGHQEHRFNKFSSIRIRPNSITGINPSVWRRFMPLGDRTIRWVYGNGPLAGIGSIFGPVHSGGRLSELSDAPFNGFAAFGCTDPRSNLRRLGLKTQRDV